MDSKDLYPSNSNASKEAAKEPKKKFEKVISGSAVVEPPKGKFYKLFHSQEARDVKDSIVHDIVIPRLQDVLMGIVESVIYGGRAPRSTYSSRYSSYDRPSYTVSSGYRYTSRDRDYRERSRPREHHDFQNVVLSSRGDAEMLLDNMIDCIQRYGMVTINQMYDMVGVTGEYTDEYFGWTSLRTARVVRDRGGYIVDLPPAQPV